MVLFGVCGLSSLLGHPVQHSFSGSVLLVFVNSLRGGFGRCGPFPNGSYLVDPASSHMLVSKIKPCMSKYKLLYTVKLRMAH